jgi:hypothetical protein
MIERIVIESLSTAAPTFDHTIVSPERLRRAPGAGYIPRMRFEKVWVEQCRATKAIKRRFGAKSALDYLIGEKLISFQSIPTQLVTATARGDPESNRLPLPSMTTHRDDLVGVVQPQLDLPPNGIYSCIRRRLSGGHPSCSDERRCS